MPLSQPPGRHRAQHVFLRGCLTRPLAQPVWPTALWLLIEPLVSNSCSGYFTADDLYVMNVTMFNEALMTDPSTAF